MSNEIPIIYSEAFHRLEAMVGMWINKKNDQQFGLQLNQLLAEMTRDELEFQISYMLGAILKHRGID